MPRAAGSKNQDHDVRRASLAKVIADALKEQPELSFRKLAEAAGVTPPTLRHYFGDHQGALSAAFSHLHNEGLQWLHLTATADLGPVDVAIPTLLKFVVEGWRRGVGRVHALGFHAALEKSEAGPLYLDKILEPSIRALEARLAMHATRGEIDVEDTRASALSLLSPILVAMLHQDWLCGSSYRPLDVDAFVALHARGFLRAHAPLREAATQ